MSLFQLNREVIVIVENVNDEHPKFEQNQYTLNVPEEGFMLQELSRPTLLVQGHLDYDKVKSIKLTLTARDTAVASPPDEPSFTATTTITVTITDADNRPPWFQPCTLTVVGMASICLDSGYTGSVNLTEQVVGAMPLEPGPLFAIDGDSGIRDELAYTFLSGNEAGLFEINENTGNITMLKAADVSGPITLRVLEQYEGVVSEVGTMVLDADGTSTPLRVEAKDPDFAELKAVDSVNGESSTTAVIVEVTSGLPTTTVAPSTTDMASTTLALTSDTTQVTSETMLPTTNVSPTTPDDLTTDNPTGVPIQSGGYGPEDMAALGASLAVLLIICMVAVVFLAVHVKKGKAAWRKLSEASIFSSSLGRGRGHAKEGVQYTNEGFQNDGDTGNTSFKEPDVTDMKLGRMSHLGTQAGDSSLAEVIARSSAPLHALLPDNSSLAGSDQADSEKEVKPILTKERRVEEGYKSVWFKEDIDPDAKEEVVIIPDNEERDIDEEDDEEEEQEDNSPPPSPNADKGGGLRVKINDPESDDSEDDEVLTADL
ncbi:uncharacterized protein cdhr5b [Aplochiton taeniatus]